MDAAMDNGNLTTMQHILLAFLKKCEGFRSMAYDDTEGLPTVGYGRLLSDGGPGWNGRNYDTKEDFNDVFPDGITEEEAEDALAEDVSVGITDAKKIAGPSTWVSLSPLRQAILANLAFNLGYGRLSKFRGFLRALNALDYPLGAVELLDSTRARQVRRRAALEAVAWITDDVDDLELG